jgi:putative oxidoreductase
MTALLKYWTSITTRLQTMGHWLPPLLLRTIMAWEFWESGKEKLYGQNWFDNIQMSFPFPFSIVPPGISWQIAIWFELIGAVLLLFGFATRFIAFSLLFLTFVATAAVHWPDMWSMLSELAQGYAVTDHGHGNFKLPLLFVVMLVPLIFSGAGQVSLDFLLARGLKTDVTMQRQNDLYAYALASIVFALPFLMLIPKFGFFLTALALVLLVIQWWRDRAVAAK